MLKKEKVDLSDLSHVCHMLERQRVSQHFFNSNKGEGILVPLDRRFVVYPGGAGVEEGSGVEEVSLFYTGTLRPSLLWKSYSSLSL